MTELRSFMRVFSAGTPKKTFSRQPAAHRERRAPHHLENDRAAVLISRHRAGTLFARYDSRQRLVKEKLGRDVSGSFCRRVASGHRCGRSGELMEARGPFALAGYPSNSDTLYCRSLQRLVLPVCRPPAAGGYFFRALNWTPSSRVTSLIVAPMQNPLSVVDSRF